MKRSLLGLVGITFLASSCYAENPWLIHKHYTLDVYRSSQLSASDLDKQYGKELTALANDFLKPKAGSDVSFPLMQAFLTKALTPLMQSGKFAYIGFTPVNYPGSDVIGFSFDVVDKDQAQRLQGFNPKPKRCYPDPANLISSWQSYEKLGFESFFRTRKQAKFTNCPAFHCIYGFEEPAFVPYGSQFNRDVPKYKTQLITILRQDKNESHRSAAAYLLAHLKNGNQVISALMPSIRDSSSQVRNSVMRVLGSTILKVQHPNIDLNAVVAALDFPATTDRNKALYMLTSLTLNPKYAAQLKLHGCKAVMQQFALSQPNLHDTAYVILTSMSNQDYPANNFAAWESWAQQNCKEYQSA